MYPHTSIVLGLQARLSLWTFLLFVLQIQNTPNSADSSFKVFLIYSLESSCLYILPFCCLSSPMWGHSFTNRTLARLDSRTEICFPPHEVEASLDFRAFQSLAPSHPSQFIPFFSCRQPQEPSPAPSYSMPSLCLCNYPTLGALPLGLGCWGWTELVSQVRHGLPSFGPGRPKEGGDKERTTYQDNREKIK